MYTPLFLFYKFAQNVYSNKAINRVAVTKTNNTFTNVIFTSLLTKNI